MKKTMMILLTGILVSTMACKNRYEVTGQILNVCGQPMAGMEVVFAGCQDPGFQFVFKQRDLAFDYSTFTDA